MTYENLGNERDDDLMLLCENCHKLMHKDKILFIDGVDLDKCLDDDNSRKLTMELLKKLDLAVICFSNPSNKLFSSRYFVGIDEVKDEEC